MRLLVVHCHPVPESFVAAVRDRALAGLARAGHETRLLDLYAMGFDPVMSAEERRLYHERHVNERPVAEHLEHLRWCEGIVFVYPTWWYGPPAMLKGWLERVWVPYATFTIPKAGEVAGPVLGNIRLLGAVSTLGSPWWWWTLAMRSPGRRILLNGLKSIAAPDCRTFWLALHRLDTVTAEERAAFLDRVERRMAALRDEPACRPLPRLRAAPRVMTPAERVPRD